MRSHATEFQPTSRNASSEERSSPSRDEGSVRAEEDGEESAEERNQRLLQRQREEMAETEARLREELQTEEVCFSIIPLCMNDQIQLVYQIKEMVLCGKNCRDSKNLQIFRFVLSHLGHLG